MFQTPVPDLDLLLLPASLTKYSDIPSLIEVPGRFSNPIKCMWGCLCDEVRVEKYNGDI